MQSTYASYFVGLQTCSTVDTNLLPTTTTANGNLIRDKRCMWGISLRHVQFMPGLRLKKLRLKELRL